LLLAQDSNYLTCIAVNKYLCKQYLLRQVHQALPSTAAAALPRLSAFGGPKPVVTARLPYTAKTRRLLLSQRLVDVAVPVQEFKYALLR
jgi:hypothetical protein